MIINNGINYKKVHKNSIIIIIVIITNNKDRDNIVIAIIIDLGIEIMKVVEDHH